MWWWKYLKMKQTKIINLDEIEPMTEEEYEEISKSDQPHTEMQKHRLRARALQLQSEGLSHCCKAPIDESRVIKEGAYTGHGWRFCSKCGDLLYCV
jgi:hypothetical protein